MLMPIANEDQRERYLAPYVQRGTISAIGISEPGAGADPAAMTTHAVRDRDEWVINGRKIWISRAAEADFTILMAVTDKARADKAMQTFRRHGYDKGNAAATHGGPGASDAHLRWAVGSASLGGGAQYSRAETLMR